ncbi:GNAT family N-acetyltransferase [Humisphaera borealis]|uniref:GNAT family N-acetyltransferase n=1 Tax=Humisphaera borealis TaxID=2807512 RepID=A0A7M2WWT2_9BACT|nr:GNAT family N-acetyltransferase [Humisphaera borealis]QOV89955.1 GNAT family N-acetyltransferase [Humisphaera borealis]
MTIRDATADDIPAILPLVRKVAAFMQDRDPHKYTIEGDVGERYRNWLGGQIASGRSAILIADAAGRDDPPAIVGMLIGTVDREIPIYRLKEYGFINDLWVDETYRNEGVARQLVTEAIERFTRLGVEQIRLDVLLTNEPARKLFETCGFRPSVMEMLLPIEPVPST